MSSIKRIDEDLRSALRSKDEDALRAIRAIKTALKNKSVELGAELKDQEALQVVRTLVKQCKDSIEQFKNGGRDDLAEAEQKELVTLESYLPPSLSEEEIEKIIDEAISETGASSPKEMGIVMKAVMQKTGGNADGKLVSSLVAKKIQAK